MELKERQIRDRYYLIDIFKIVFAVLIVIHHLQLQYGIVNVFSKAIDCIMIIAVPFFFCTSGFFFFRKLNNNLDNKKEIIIPYIIKILKMYLLWMGLMFLLRIPQVVENGLNLKAQLIYFAKYLRVVVLIGDYQLWYLLGLIQAVIIFWILFRRNSLKLCVVFAIILYFLSIILTFQQDFLQSNFYISRIIKYYNMIFGTYRNGIFQGFSFFILGCVFVKLDLRKISNKSIWIVISSIGIVLTTIVGCFLSREKTNEWAVLVVSLTLILIMLLSLIVKQKPFNGTLRDLSTLIFLSHMLLIIVIKPLLVSFNELIVYSVNLFIVGIVDSIILIMSKRFVFLKNLY